MFRPDAFELMVHERPAPRPACENVQPSPVPVPRAAGDRTAAHALLDALADLGARTIFLCPGVAIEPLCDALDRHPRLKPVRMEDEVTAVHAAHGYARVTGQVGVVIVGAGAATGRAAAGLMDALSDSVPVLCIGGQVGMEELGTDALHECDTMSITLAVTKWNARIREAAHVGPITRKAALVAARDRPGPVFIDIPNDLLSQPCPSLQFHPDVHLPQKRRRPPRVSHYARAVEALRAARRPVLLGGGGLVSSGPRACERFAQVARMIDAPCALSMMGLGAFPASDSRYLGMAGLQGTLQANQALRSADLVMCVGTRLDAQLTGRVDGFAAGACVIHIDVDPTSINKRIASNPSYVGDAGVVLSELLPLLDPSDFDPDRLTDWWTRIHEWQALSGDPVEEPTRDIAPAVLVTRLDQALRASSAATQRPCIVCADVGAPQLLAARHLGLDRPRQWVTSGGAASKGFALPASIGAQIACPDAAVVCLTDERSLMASIQEMGAARRHRTPIRVVLFSDTECTASISPDPVALALAFGWSARRISDRDDLDEALRCTLIGPGPSLLAVRVQARGHSPSPSR